MRTAAKRISKATMVAEKDRAIVLAAHDHFLRDGFAGASMDAIAKSAGVSVKTIYSHFVNKEELFSKVMIAACTDHLLSSELPPNSVLAERFAWFREVTQHGLMEAGREYAASVLLGAVGALSRRHAGRRPFPGSRPTVSSKHRAGQDRHSGRLSQERCSKKILEKKRCHSGCRSL
jgi:AcrR family transcriptional regulator